MTFATGVVAGIVAIAFVGFLVFKARVIAGSAPSRLPDLRTAISVIALVVAVVAFVRSGHTDPRSTSGPPDSPTRPPPTAPEISTSTVSSSSTTSSSFLSTVTVPSVVGLSQSAAVAELQNAGLTSKIESLPLSNVPPGFVVTQTPIALSTTTSGAVVLLGVSAAA